MATTWMKALHRLNGISVAAALDKNADYILDRNKTEDGKLVDSYECHPFTAQAEFLFSKQLYAQKTGRNQGKRDVIAYHIRMSFKPGEVTDEKALELGKELAMRWTKGKHQFIVAAHSNTNNPHVHIIFNSVTLDCDRKFQDFKRSAIALRRVSDQLCLEHGLSIIEKPGLSKGYNRREYLNGEKPVSIRDKLRDLINSNIVQGMTFEEFISAMKKAGCEVKRGKHLAFKIPDGKKFIRCNSLGDDYIESALLERLSADRLVVQKEKSTISETPSIQKPNLLIDIQAKIQQDYGPGFKHWAGIRNLRDAAKTLLFLQERGLDNYDLLAERTESTTKSFNKRSGRIKEIDTQQKEISTLQKHIGSYAKTKEVLAEYNRLKSIKPSGFAKFISTQTPAQKFYAENESAIKRCVEAKKFFDKQGYGRGNNKKLPTIKSLQIEYNKLEAEKKKLYSGFKVDREEMIALKVAKQNVDMILGESQQSPKSYERDTR